VRGTPELLLKIERNSGRKEKNRKRKMFIFFSFFFYLSCFFFHREELCNDEEESYSEKQNKMGNANKYSLERKRNDVEEETDSESEIPPLVGMNASVSSASSVSSLSIDEISKMSLYDLTMKQRSIWKEKKELEAKLEHVKYISTIVDMTIQNKQQKRRESQQFISRSPVIFSPLTEYQNNRQ